MSVSQKQQYLRTQIVEQGEDPQKFYEFFQNYNIDLQDADFDTVINIVRQYKQKRTEQKQDKNDNEDDDDQFGDFVQPVQHDHTSAIYADMNWDFLAQKSKKQQTPVKGSKIQTEIKESNKKIAISSDSKMKSSPNDSIRNNSKNSDQIQKIKNKERKINQNLLNHNQVSISKEVNNVTFQEVLKNSQKQKRKCLKLQPNILDHHVNVQIFITKMEEVSEQNSGLINKLWKGINHVFTIKTVGRNKQKAVGISWQVKRTYEDFDWLRAILMKMYPGFVVPPLPKPIKDLNLMNGYQRKLQSFLLDCYRCPQLRNSKYFQVFLSYSKDFQNFKKNSESSSKPKDIEHILNMKGEVSLLYGQSVQQYSNGLQNFLYTSSQHLKNVKTIIEQINSLFQDLSIKYRQLSDVFIVMSSQSCNFSQQQCYPRLTQTYKQISNLINQHSQFCLEQKDFVETFMHSHFAYEKDRIDNLQNLVSKRKTYINQYIKPKHQNGKVQAPTNSMFSKITGLFGDKSQSIDIPSGNTQTLKQQVGYFNSQLMNQSIRSVEGMITSHVNHFSLYGHSRIDNVQTMQRIWSSVLVQLSKLNTK